MPHTPSSNGTGKSLSLGVDDVDQEHDKLDVGSDLAFQQKWWRFERIVWVVFTAIVLLDLAGVFGRGPLARATATAADGTMSVEYERVARFSAPSLVTVHFNPPAEKDGAIHVWASDSLLQAFGVQKLNPEPERVTLDGAGFTYTYRSSPQANSIQFAMEPRRVGLQKLTLRVADAAPVTMRVLVLP